MRLGQPGMEGHHAGLAAEAEERQHEREGPESRAEIVDAIGGELEAAGLGRHDEIRNHDHQEAYMRHDQVHEAALDGLLLLLDDDQEIRGQRHELEEDQEPERVIDGDDAVHGRDEEVHEQAHGPQAVFLVLVEVGKAVQERREREDVDDRQQKAGDRIEQQGEVGEGERRRDGQTRPLADNALEAGEDGEQRRSHAEQARDDLGRMGALAQEQGEEAADDGDRDRGEQDCHTHL